MKFLFLLVALSVFVLIFASCANKAVGIAPSTTPITSHDSYVVIGPAEGTAYGMSILGIPFFESDQAGLARDRAIESSGADALIEVAEDFTSFNLLLFAVFTTDCEGTAVKINKGVNR